MDPVVIECEADEQGIHTEHVLEVGHNRNRPPCPDRHRLVSPFIGEHRARFAQRCIYKRKFDRWRQTKISKFALAVARQTGVHEVAEGVTNFPRILLTDKPERDFRAGFTGDDSFGAFPRIPADDAVDLSRWSGRDLLDQQVVFLTSRIFQSDWT